MATAPRRRSARTPTKPRRYDPEAEASRPQRGTTPARRNARRNESANESTNGLAAATAAAPARAKSLTARLPAPGVPGVASSLSWGDVAETASWLATSVIVGIGFYNNIGGMAAWRGVDYADLIITRFDVDGSIPLVPILIVPYVLVYGMPVLFVAAVVLHGGLRLGPIRRFFAVNMLTIVIAYALYILFPVAIDAIAIPPEDIGDSYFDRVNHSFVHAGMSKFCAFPSLHVMSTVLVAWSFRANELPGTAFAALLALVTCASTVCTRAHFIADVFGGLALALAIGLFVLQPLERRRSFEPDTVAGRPRRTQDLAVLALVPMVLAAGSVLLTRATGCGTNPLAMLGLL